MCKVAVIDCPHNSSLAQKQPSFAVGLQPNILSRLTIENDFTGTGSALSSHRGLKSFMQALSSTWSFSPCALHWRPEHKSSRQNLMLIRSYDLPAADRFWVSLSSYPKPHNQNWHSETWCNQHTVHFPNGIKRC